MTDETEITARDVLTVVALFSFSVLMAFNADHLSTVLPYSWSFLLAAALVTGVFVAEALSVATLMSSKDKTECSSAMLALVICAGCHYYFYQSSVLAFTINAERGISQEVSDSDLMKELRAAKSSLYRQLNQVDKTSERAEINQLITENTRQMAIALKTQESPTEKAMRLTEQTTLSQAERGALLIEAVLMALSMSWGGFMGGLSRPAKPASKPTNVVPISAAKKVAPKTMRNKFVERQKVELVDYLGLSSPAGRAEPEEVKEYSNVPGRKRAADFETKLRHVRENADNIHDIEGIKAACKCGAKTAQSIRDTLYAENIWQGPPPRRALRGG